MLRQQLIKRILREGLNLRKRSPITPEYISEVLFEVSTTANIVDADDWSDPIPNEISGFLVDYDADFSVVWNPGEPYLMTVILDGSENDPEFYYHFYTELSGNDVKSDAEAIITDMNNHLNTIGQDETN